MGESIEALKKMYQKFLSAGLFLLLSGFALLIFKPLGSMPSLVVGAFLFGISFVPLELARRTARKIVLMAFREE
ncbi:hypothetical protein [Thermococcus sp.]